VSWLGGASVQFQSPIDELGVALSWTAVFGILGIRGIHVFLHAVLTCGCDWCLYLAGVSIICVNMVRTCGALNTARNTGLLEALSTKPPFQRILT
jgi:hypothetical protein